MKDADIPYYYLPKDLSSLLDFTRISLPITRCILFILAYLRYFSDISYGKLKNSDFTQLNSHMVANSLSCPYYKRALEILLKAGILTCDNYYKVGEKCKSYRFCDSLIMGEWERTSFLQTLNGLKPPISDAYGERRVDAWARMCDTLQNWETLPAGELRNYCENVQKYLKGITFEMPDEELNPLLDEIAEQSFEEYREDVKKDNELISKKNESRALKGKAPLPLKPILSSVELIRKCYVDSIGRIRSGEFFIKVHTKSRHFDTGSGRVFTDVTICHKKLRKALRYNGQKLVNIDIKCCQAMLLSTLYENSPAQQTEKAKFIKFFEGDFYADIAKQSGSNISRDAAKVESFTLFFAKNYTASKTKFTKAFKKEFPLLYGNIRNLKRENYRYVAHLLQSAEANIVVKGVSTDLFAQGIPNFTIHDSVMTTEENVKLVEKALADKFFEITGVVPVLKTEYYN